MFTEKFIKYAGIGANAHAVWESADDRVVAQVDRQEATDCEVRRGSPEQRPWISAGLGLALMLPCLIVGTQTLVDLSDSNDRLSMRVGFALIFTALLGAVLLFRTLFVRRYYLSMATRTGEVRLIFARRAELSEIRKFLADVEHRYGWTVRDAVS